MCADNVSLELSMKVDADLSGLLVVVGEDSLVVAGVLMVPGGCLVAEYLSVYSILISITADWLWFSWAAFSQAVYCLVSEGRALLILH